MIRIPSNTSIIGELRSSGEIRIDGRFQGEGHIDGTLLLTETSVWIGSAVADIIVVEGVFEGNIIARKKMIVGPKAKIRGDVKAPAIKIAYGAKLLCNLDMVKPQVTVGLLEHKPEHKSEHKLESRPEQPQPEQQLEPQHQKQKSA